jgi:hypothetical protein
VVDKGLFAVGKKILYRPRKVPANAYISLGAVDAVDTLRGFSVI